MSILRLAVAALCVSFPVCAETIISTGVGPDGPAVYAMQFEEQGWTQTQTYTDVSIEVALYSWTPGAAFDGTAYLTNSIGPGAVQQALDKATYSGETADSTPEMITLFSGLTLGPGTYYLTLASTDNIGIQPGAIWDMECRSCSITLDSGVTLLSQNFASAQSENGSYPPGSNFAASSPALNLTVTGQGADIVVPVNSPEPASWLAVMAGLAAAAYASIRRRGRCCDR
jgi:hypothetical protein